jgi:hypothetical protein
MKKQAEALMRIINKDIPGVETTGMSNVEERAANGRLVYNYGVNCQDTVTGGQFTVWTLDDWQRRQNRPPVG